MLNGNTIKGMVWDSHSDVSDEQTYSFVFNGNLHNHSSEQSYPFISNNISNVECINFIKGYKVIGILSIKELSSSILTLYNEDTGFKIFLKVDYLKKDLGKGDRYEKLPNKCIRIIENSNQETNCEYSELLHTNCFNWDNTYPLRLEYKITDTTLNLYFVNGLDQDRFISFELDDFSLSKEFKLKISPDDCDINYTEGLDCDKTLWYPLVEQVEIDLQSVSGGSKLPGKYNYLFAYSTNKGIPLTPFSGLGQGISLFNIGKESTEYGVKITVKNVSKESRYRYYTIAVVEATKGQTRYKQVGTYPVSQTTIFDWNNDGASIGLPILLTQYPFYKYSRSITESNNILFKAGLSEFEKFNLQPLISKVQVEWVTTVVEEGFYKDSNEYISFLRDEVYALGIEIILDNLEKGPTFLLVNREKRPSDDILFEGESLWKKDNTATRSWLNPVTDKKLLFDSVKQGNDVIYEYGEFGYHESSDRYPNVKEIWGDLCNQPIRHFRFPDHKTTTHYSSSPSYNEKNYIHPLGVRIKTDMNNLFDQALQDGLITQEQRKRIVGWKLVRANRNGNNSIVAKGLLYDMWKYERDDRDENFSLFSAVDTVCQRDGKVNYYPNYPFNDLRDDPFLTEEYRWYIDKTEKNISDYEPVPLKFQPSNRYTFHSPDTHFTNPNLGTQLKIEAISSGVAEGFFNQAEEQAKQRLLNWKHYDAAIKLARYIASLQNSPTQQEVQQLATNTGNTVGNVVGSAISMVPGVGAAIGGVVKAVGGLIGGLVGEKIYKGNGWFQFIESSFRSTIVYTETEKLINIFEFIVKPKQYHYQYQAVGNYHKINTTIPTNQKFRDLLSKEYIGNGKYTIDGDLINNFNRESSVYLNVDRTIQSIPVDPVTGIQDTSRILISDSTGEQEIVLKKEEEVTCNKYNVYFNENISVNHEAFYHVWGELCTTQRFLTRSEVAVPMKYIFDDLDSKSLEEGTLIFFSDTFDEAGFMSTERYDGEDTIPFYKWRGKYKAMVVLDEDKNYKLLLHSEYLGALHATTNPNRGGFLGFNSDSIAEKCYANISIEPFSPEYLITYYCTNVGLFGGCIGSWKRAWSDEQIATMQTFDYRYDSSITVEEVEFNCGSDFRTTYKIEKTNCSCNRIRQNNIASYYGSLKQSKVNPYGTVYDIQWLNTGSGVNSSNKGIYGGDTFIGRMTLKRKHSFFNLNLFNNPTDTEINYSLLGNAANPIYYFDKNPIKIEKEEFNLTSLTFPLNLNKTNRHRILNLFESHLFRIENQVQKPKYKLDCASSVLEDTFLKKLEMYSTEGFIYLYSYGIISFIAESNINLDLRDKGEDLAEDFYPNQSDLSVWLQEKNVSPALDNFYKYDRSYSKQPTEEFHYQYDANFRGEQDKILHTNRIIYSSQGSEIDDDDYSDVFLVNRALDRYDFSKKHGEVISIEGIEGDKVLVRQEHNSSVFGAYITLNSDQNTVLISAGTIFNNKPVEFATPNLGYFGSQHQVILNTPFGHITIDALRGQVFLLGNGGQNLEEISNKGMFSFFKEYLPFQLSRYIKNVNIDNNFNGIGLSMVYDNRFQVFHLTKLDYVPLVDGITFEKSSAYKGTKFKHNNKIIELSDSNYFCNVSWTISYSFVNQAWYSFQPFTPNFYIEHIDYFDSGNDVGIWRHNITNKTYQEFYGQYFPFIVETSTKFDGMSHQVKNVNYMVDVIQYMNKYDKIIKKDKGFNKAIVSTDNQTSGLLHLTPTVDNNLYLRSRMPLKKETHTEVELVIKEDVHSFNQFRDIVKYNNIPLWLRKCDTYFEELNTDAIDNLSRKLSINTIIGDKIKVRLIQDKENKYQYIFKGTFINDLTKRRM